VAAASEHAAAYISRDEMHRVGAAGLGAAFPSVCCRAASLL
jgi:hypothetical protein